MTSDDYRSVAYSTLVDCAAELSRATGLFLDTVSAADPTMALRPIAFLFVEEALVPARAALIAYVTLCKARKDQV
jgi:hypothetical protein